MSIRLPLGTCEFHFGYANAFDAERMYTSLAFIALTEGWDSGEVQAVLDSWADHFGEFASEEWSIGGGYALIGTADDPIRIEQTGPSVVGTGPSFGVPDNCAYLLRKTAEGGGRRSRGRMFIPGVGSGLVDTGGTITAGVVTAMNTAIAEFTNEVFTIHDPGDAFPALLHGTLYTRELVGGRIVRVPVPDSELPPTRIINMSFASKIATQRHRMRP